ncbi:MAG: DUF6452 family protein [Flavobacteriales bacterium]
MKKINYTIGIVTVLCTFLFMYSCEDDEEICEEGTTARLVIRFYDGATGQATKKSGVFSTSEFSDITFSSQDSIQIPLSLKNSMDTLFYKASVDAQEIDTITLSFTRTEEYVSKGCGFKVNYTEVNAALGATSKILKKWEWNPKLIDTNNEITITDEAEAHMFIYF